MSEKITPLPADQLMAKPALSFEEFFCHLLGLPQTTAEELAKGPDAPQMFLIGRRRYIRRVDGLEWIDRQAERKPYFPRKNNRNRD